MDFNMDSIIFLFVFVFPGALSKLIKERFFPRKQYRISDSNGWVELSEMVVFSIIVLFTGLIVRAYFLTRNLDINNYFASFTSTKFLIIYIIFAFFASIVYTALFHILNKTLVPFVINFYNQWKGRPTEGLYQTIWEEIFETNKYFEKKQVVVSIEKDGHILSRGFLEAYPPPQSPNNELLLKYCSEIEAYFKNDESLPEGSKIFDKTYIEYFDMQNGYVIKFYDMQKYNDYINNQKKSS